MRPLPDAAMQPRKDMEYNVVFNITQAGEKPGLVSAGLERLAGFINQYESGGGSAAEHEARSRALWAGDARSIGRRALPG